MPAKPAYSDDDLLYVGDAADFVGVHADTLRRWEESGAIKAVRTPTNQRRFKVRDLRALRDGQPSAPNGDGEAA